ncbi:MAG TPA: hypothetical protein VFW96_19020 [Thermomicrobiales bacterium]|nr:hypothetical protein [Thermomicrobiales bacterium]
MGRYRPRARRLVLALALLLALLAAPWPPGAGGAAPALTLTPDRGPCTGTIAIRGTGLPPGTALALTARRTSPPSDLAVRFTTPTADAGGAFTVVTEVRLIVAGCADATTPAAGTKYTIYLTTNPTGRPGGALLATAIFTVAAASGAAAPGLPNTGGGSARGWSWQLAGPLAVGVLAALLGLVARRAGAAGPGGRGHDWGRLTAHEGRPRGLGRIGNLRLSGADPVL